MIKWVEGQEKKKQKEERKKKIQIKGIYCAVESKDTIEEQQTGEVSLAWIGHERRREKWNDRPVALQTRWGGLH